MKKVTDPRHLARQIALQRLFAQDFNILKEGIELHTPEDLAVIDEIDNFTLELCDKLVDGVNDNRADIDNIIKQYAPQWPIDQMKLVDIQVLRIAIFEGFISKITPPKVAIDEAIEVARTFGDEINGKFVNGVLGAIYEKEKENEHK
jgi:transcription antitermination protein NusB